MGYKLKLDVFEGPLDLLLYLIKKDDIDIRDIPIAKVTEQYLQFIEMMKILDLDIVGDFLVMAATLMQIKSKMLLPPDPVEVEGQVEDPRDELVRRLMEYQRFKEIAGILQDKETERKDFFARMVDEQHLQAIKEDAKEKYFDTNLFDLINALTEALKRLPEEQLHEIVREEYTVEQKIHEILHALLAHERLSVRETFQRCRSRAEVVVTFLAVLELIRLKEIKAVQQALFGDIEICRNKENIIPQENTQEDGSQENQSEQDEDTPDVAV